MMLRQARSACKKLAKEMYEKKIIDKNEYEDLVSSFKTPSERKRELEKILGFKL